MKKGGAKGEREREREKAKEGGREKGEGGRGRWRESQVIHYYNYFVLNAKIISINGEMCYFVHK